VKMFAGKGGVREKMTNVLLKGLLAEDEKNRKSQVGKSYNQRGTEGVSRVFWNEETSAWERS